MGNNQTNQISFQNNYSLVKQIDDIRYGKVSVMKNNLDQKLYAVKEHVSNSLEAHEKTIFDIEQQQMLNSPFLIKKILIFKEEQNEYCSKFYKVVEALEYLDSSLEDEILLRQQQKNSTYFSEKELLNVWENTIDALLYLKSQNKSHEFICPQNILKNFEDYYQLFDSQSNSMIKMYQKQLFEMDTVSDNCYLSYEQCQQLPRINPSYDVYQSDVFSLGMTILEIGNLGGTRKAYKITNNVLSVDNKQLKKLIESFKKCYSISLSNLLIDMLSNDPSIRPTFKTIKDRLSVINQCLQNGRQKNNQMITHQDITNSSNFRPVFRLSSETSENRYQEYKQLYQNMVNNTMVQPKQDLNVIRINQATKEIKTIKMDDIQPQVENQLLQNIKKSQEEIKQDETKLIESAQNQEIVSITNFETNEFESYRDENIDESPERIYKSFDNIRDAKQIIHKDLTEQLVVAPVKEFPQEQYFDKQFQEYKNIENIQTDNKNYQKLMVNQNYDDQPKIKISILKDSTQTNLNQFDFEVKSQKQQVESKKYTKYEIKSDQDVDLLKARVPEIKLFKREKAKESQENIIRINPNIEVTQKKNNSNNQRIQKFDIAI